MKWTRTKPTKPGYYFYRDGGTNHDVVCVAYDLYDQLSFWEEWDKVWVPVEQGLQDAEWSNFPIPLPMESGTLDISLSEIPNDELPGMWDKSDFEGGETDR